MELILIRHGKAEERQESLDDARRKLTPEGRRRLQATLPSLGILIRNLGKAQIWSSQLDRSLQSAEVIAKVFGVAQIQTFDFIADGDFDQLITALSGVKPSSTVLVVGHEPHLGEWSQKLCGLVLPFKKGSAAAIRIKGFQPLEADLLWFFQPQPLGRLGETLFNNRSRGSG